MRMNSMIPVNCKTLVLLFLIVRFNMATAQDSLLVSGTNTRNNYDDKINELVNNFFGTGEHVATQIGGNDLIGKGIDRSQLFSLMVVEKESPFLSRSCKEDAVRFAVEKMFLDNRMETRDLAITAATNHMNEQVRLIRENGISYSEYLKHAGACKSFCGPLTASLLNCHVLSVAQNPHGIILFEFNSDVVDKQFEEGIIEQIRTELTQDNNKNVLLIGRASQIGDLRYNRALSGKRAESVKNELVEKGIAPSRVSLMAFGWEPPQLDPWIAEEYGLNALFAEIGSTKMNQSVMVVIY